MYLAGFIGCGSMGGALAAVAAKRAGGGNILTADHNRDKLERLRRSWGTVPASAREIAESCRFIFLGVKPQGMEKAAEELRDTLEGREDRFVAVTMAAGLTAEAVSEMLGGCPVIRMMPNTPCAVGEGVIVYCAGGGVTEEDETAFLELMRPAGVLEKLEENKIDMASAVTGCGPAFVYLFLEAMIDGAVRCGLKREEARLFALQTAAGAAKLALDTGRDPALLRGEVCSPAGSTIEGVAALEERAVRGAVMEAVYASYRRAARLGS